MNERGLYRLTYRDGGGEDTERLISDIAAEGDDAITAHCHLRDARRTFRLPNILRLVDLATGEVITDPWTWFGVRRVAWPLDLKLMPAMKALKYLTRQLRGLAARELAHLVRFARQACPECAAGDAELEAAIKGLWPGEESDYRRHLAAIPGELRAACRLTARSIAFGSGRRPVNPAIWARIDSEFPSSGAPVHAGPVWPALYIDDERPSAPANPHIEHEDPYELIRAQLAEFKVDMQLLLAVAGLATEYPSQAAREVVVRFIAAHTPVDQQAAALLMRYMRSRRRTREEDVMRLGRLTAKHQACQRRLQPLLTAAREILRLDGVTHDHVDRIARALEESMQRVRHWRGDP